MSAPETFAYWGLVALDRFEQLDAEGQAKAIAFGERLKAMSDTELFAECKDHIWTEAVLESRSRYSLMSDLMCAMCCVESNKRAPEGVKPYSAETIYARAHKACMAEAGALSDLPKRLRQFAVQHLLPTGTGRALLDEAASHIADLERTVALQETALAAHRLDASSEFKRLAPWQRSHGDGDVETIYKLPDGTEYTGNLYGRD